MYGVPTNLDLSGFVGSRLHFIGLGEFQIQFAFQREQGASPGKLTHGFPPRPGPYVSVEGRWDLSDSTGAVLDGSCEHHKRESYRLHRLLGRSVTAWSVDPPRSFTLTFENGDVLRVCDDSRKFESFSIQPGDIFV